MKTRLTDTHNAVTFAHTMRKKATNLTISGEMLERAETIMARKGFTSFSGFVEQLIREEFDRQTSAGNIVVPAVALIPRKSTEEIKAAILGHGHGPKKHRKAGNG